MLREWSLFTAGGVEFRKWLALKTCPLLDNRAPLFCPHLRTCALKSCPPPQRTYIHMCVKTYDLSSINLSFKIYYENGKSLGNILISCEEISATPAAAKIFAVVFSHLEMALRCLCTQILPPSETVH